VIIKLTAKFGASVKKKKEISLTAPKVRPEKGRTYFIALLHTHNEIIFPLMRLNFSLFFGKGFYCKNQPGERRLFYGWAIQAWILLSIRTFPLYM